MLPETHIHVLLDISGVFGDVGDNALLDGPTKEIQLTHRRLLNGGMPADLETNTLTAAERVEETFGICLELALVVEMRHELSAFVSIGDVELL